MKIDRLSINNINNPKYSSKRQAQNKENPTKDVKQSSLLCQCLFGKAQVNMQKPDAIEIIKRIMDKNCIIGRELTEDGIKRIQIREPIEGFSDLAKTVAHASCYYDENNNLKRIYFKDDRTNKISVYDGFGNLENQYSSDDYLALKYYKYHPNSIHKLLRKDKNLYSGDWAEETKECINTLSKIFEQHKTHKTEKPMVLYRGMDIGIEDIGNVGDIYEDKSFVSTTTDIEVAKCFANGHPVMEISVPKGLEYLDMDGLFNIDKKHWREKEFLLNKKSKFKITGYDEENNIVKAEYAGQD